MVAAMYSLRSFGRTEAYQKKLSEALQPSKKLSEWLEPWNFRDLWNPAVGRTNEHPRCDPDSAGSGTGIVNSKLRINP